MSKEEKIKKIVKEPEGLLKKSLLGLGSLLRKKPVSSDTSGNSSKGSSTSSSQSDDKSNDNK